MSEESSPARRGTFVSHDAVYAAIGASSSTDLLRFPPNGSTPFETALKLGSGQGRFLQASNTLMTWSAHRSAGIEVLDVRLSSGEQYAGLELDENGSARPLREPEVSYGPDGEAFLTAGSTATLSWHSGKVSRGVRVVYVIDEDRRAGYALGTTSGEGVVGETSYVVEHRDDDSVWAIARGFYWPPASGLLRLRGRAAMRLAQKDAAQVIASLMPGVVRGDHGNGSLPVESD